MLPFCSLVFNFLVHQTLEILQNFDKLQFMTNANQEERNMLI